MRLYRWQARRTIGQLADRAGGAALHGLMPWEVTEILSLADDWGDIDGSHRKLAHRGIREQRVWVSPSTVARVLEANGRELSPKPARRRRAAPVPPHPLAAPANVAGRASFGHHNLLRTGQTVRP